MSVDDLIALLKARRKALGLTQAQAAKRAGVNHYTVYNAERRRNAPQLDVFLRLCEGLGLELRLVAPEQEPRGDVGPLVNPHTVEQR